MFFNDYTNSGFTMDTQLFSGTLDYGSQKLPSEILFVSEITSDTWSYNVNMS